MKTILLSALLLVTATSSFAQGILIFSNGPTNVITYIYDGSPAPGGPAQDDTQVGLYIGNVGDSPGSLTLITRTNCSNPGRFAGGTRTLAGWNPGTVQVQVRAWLASTVYPSFEAAYAAGRGGDDSVAAGCSAPFNITLVGQGIPPNSTATSGLTPFYLVPLFDGAGPVCVPVPEPSALALGFIGLAVLVLFRSRR